MSLGVELYVVELRFRFGDLTYEGVVDVHVSSVGDLLLNAVDLGIRSVEVDGRPVDYSYDGRVLRVRGPISGVVRVLFNGRVGDRLLGIYRAPYRDGYMITTQFEPTGARYFIPCVDNPAAKARFRVRVLVDGDYDVIFNTPPVRVYWDGPWKVFEFAETPRISTYLLYLGIGRFFESRDRVGNVDVIFATPLKDRVEDGRFALDVAKGVLEFYSGYFGIPYPLPKLHLIHVPEFAAGAMENWGAITFRETALLVGRGSTELTRRRVAEVVAHEIAHQWFGNLVTMRWWDDLWLNESFATFMSYKAMDRLFPGWGVWYRFLADETVGSMLRDSLVSTHPVHVPISSEEEAFEIFDDISYGKGASLLRMLENYVGEEEFRKGLSNYLRKYAYSNATEDDLWSSIEEVSGKPVTKVMKAWVDKPGHPVIVVEEPGKGITLRQSRFILSGNTADTWPIPIVYRFNGAVNTVLMEHDTLTLSVSSASLFLNVNGSGYYRVRYTDWSRALSNASNHFERWSVINDAYAHLLQGSISLSEYLSLVRSVSDIVNYLITTTVITQLGTLYSIKPSAVKEVFTEYLRAQSTLLEGVSGMDDVRELVLSRRALVDEDYAMSIAGLIRDYQGLSPVMRQAVVNAYAVVGERPFETLRGLYRTLVSDEDRNRVLAAMLSVTDRDEYRKSLDFLMSGEVKRQDLQFFTVGSRNPYVRDINLGWLMNNYKRFIEAYGDPGVLSRVFTYSIPFIGLGQEDEVERFLLGLNIQGIEMGVKAGLELMRVYSRLLHSI
ncbi:M1 family metallopeptidase [Vulcanisaeta distributa]|uniref:Aminopeptidase n=1 Tax=Vulcanisaeta distributa (strain DSM 14429 / JCM 11212 / NBRC 100878 / IC-017) TaxID=572478 RepID=E1QSC1_VULDI|nr:M1 family metallopeptidase [Vulcanisaeta distributa]ADN49514.1 Peptidase M1 membrane alanine aminopeptidase [Vulcanisaeta distributa DSM 14429]